MTSGAARGGAPSDALTAQRLPENTAIIAIPKDTGPAGLR
jgi:hypothetical protein